MSGMQIEGKCIGKMPELPDPEPIEEEQEGGNE